MSRLNSGMQGGVNKKILVTAGPTYEEIDPVRFIGNHSSGKMGYAIADVFSRMGAEVILVSGPTTIQPEMPGVIRRNVISADEMYQACEAVIPTVDIAVFAAAVSDFKPSQKKDSKMKSSPGHVSLQLIPTKDIAAEMGKRKKPGQVFVGFALETENGLLHAESKLRKKNLDLIVLNTLEDEGAGFGTDTNKVTMIDKSGYIDKFELKLKSEVARDVVEKTLKLFKNA